MSTEQQIFKNGSTTYYFSSKFFPRDVRDDVFKLYSFVRIADNYVDDVPAQPKRFKALRSAWDSAKNDKTFDAEPNDKDTTDERVIKNIVFVTRKYGFDHAWVESFLDSMQADLDKKAYQTLDDTLWYIYGSAEVIGLMMSRIMGLPDEALEAARLQGRAMQFINFIRDISEDNKLGRCYFPAPELKRFGLKDLKHPEAGDFVGFIRFQLERYDEWQAAADTGFKYIPRALRIPLKTAVDMYNWTGSEIAKDPFIVFQKKIKPRKRRVLLRAGQLFVLEGK